MFKVKCMFKINVLVFFYNCEDISQLVLIFLMLNFSMMQISSKKKQPQWCFIKLKGHLCYMDYKQVKSGHSTK